MDKKRFVYSAVFLVIVILFFAIPVSAFLTSEALGEDTARTIWRFGYKVLKDQGSLIAGIIALIAALITVRLQIYLRDKNRFDDKKEILAREVMKMDSIVSSLSTFYNLALGSEDNSDYILQTKGLNDDFKKSLYEIKLTSASLFPDLIDEVRDYIVLLDILSKAQDIRFHGRLDYQGFIDFIVSRKLDKNYSGLLYLRKQIASMANNNPLDTNNLDDSDNNDVAYKSVIFNNISGLVDSLKRNILDKLLKL